VRGRYVGGGVIKVGRGSRRLHDLIPLGFSEYGDARRGMLGVVGPRGASECGSTRRGFAREGERGGA